MSFGGTAEDLWRHTLSRIETVFGRLEYLASLRDPHSGKYQHFGLEQRFGSEAANLVLRASHEAVFADWVGFSLEAQKREVLKYLAIYEEPPERVLASWLQVRPFATWVPANRRAAERSLFLSDLDLLLELIRREIGVAAPDPDA